LGWFGYPYGYPYWSWRFPWLPTWWTGLYGPVPPYAAIPKEQEIAMLEDQRKRMEEALKQINKRLKELKKEGATD